MLKASSLCFSAHCDAIILQVFCIVVRETGSPEFDAIASEPTDTYLHRLNDYDALTEIIGKITEQTCLAGK